MTEKRSGWTTVDEVVAPAELHWFPLMVGEWLGSTAISMMLIEQEGAYGRLLKLAWGKGDKEPSLPADDATLAQMSRLGSRWKKLGGLVRAQFQEREGKLYNAKLTSVWVEQQWKHASAVAKASAGGKAKAERARARSVLQAEPEAVLQTSLGSANKNSEGEAKTPSGFLRSPDLDGKRSAPAALGAEAPRGRDGGVIVDPYVAAEKAAEPEVQRRHALEKALSEKYDDELLASVERWRPAHEAEYADHRILAIKSLGLFGKQLSKAQQDSVDMATAIRVREAEGWPSRSRWVAKRRDEELAGETRMAS